MLAALVIPLLVLTAVACGGSENSPPKITAGAKFGEKPTVSKGKGTPPKKLEVNVISQGSGPTLAKGSLAEVNYLGQTYDSDTPFDTSFGKQPFNLVVGTGQVIKGWDQALEGQKAGSRITITIPPDLGYGAQGQPPQIPPNATLFFVVDILKGVTPPPSAKGTVQPQNDSSLPKVGTNTDGKAPSLDVPKTTAPKNLVSNYVIEGTGPQVKNTDTVIVQYKSVLWDGAKQFDSTYERGAPTTLTLNQIPVKGLSQGLTGKKVGSRVLLVLPPDQAFGSQPQNGVPANSTLVFSMDILGTM
ncbi:FKBP-type peptidyl-prolyl cis-trans isomerase [Streptomyces ferralitis]|uniref:Peptidyl-prolyl cis-trans isomerase n=1 Tax=Streptantibioticus ferralitis TaxID=236510 RepID=A0ABT5Z7T8_9ACTN|nr:FKBP-type peptidyl-prolyl cis-trans isomerase [Streptantibioticus ferralitis]MDF2259606.1 FKBP-type peptidyl-prolyl cis-trans isomerase [Streptantibioticus ferralitis]